MGEALGKKFLASITDGDQDRSKSRREDPASVKEDATANDQTRQFEAIFLAHWSHVYDLLLRLVGDPDEAEDLALETFIRLHDRAALSDPALNTGGWLRRVATNLGLDAIRGWKRRDRYELEAGKTVLEEHPDNNPSNLLVKKEERRYVRKILGEMNPRMAQLLVLRFSGLSYQEIAAVLDTAVSSIGPLLLRAEKEFTRRYHAAELEE